jgi:predicted nucleic acid-binding protein
MDPFVLDASVAISWCFPGDPTEDTPYSRRVLAALTVRDALVRDLALRHRLPLATTDEALRKVALAEGVELFP